MPGIEPFSECTPHRSSIPAEMPRRLELWGGVEATVNRVGDQYHNQLRRNGHWDRIDDLDRIAALGIRTLRFPLLWEELAQEESEEIDWEWADSRMERLRALGIRPIVGLVHHGSGPRHTSLVDPLFPEKLARYARAIAERYPWVDLWTPVNEPLTTARFSGLYGHWYPHGRDTATFAQCLLAEVDGIRHAMRAIREVNPAAQLVQTEDLGETTSTPRLKYQADFENERRWLSFDLLTGTLPREGDGWAYLRRGGIPEAELARFAEEPCPPAFIGINHYITSARHLDEDMNAYPAQYRGGNGRDRYADVEAVRARPEGFLEPAQILRAAWERYRLPIAITEAHMGCSREEQIRWFAEIWRAAEGARTAGVPVAAVTAWSLFGAFDWNSLVTRADGFYEPGVWDIRSPSPRPTALARLLQALAGTGELRSPMLESPGWWRRQVRYFHVVRQRAEAPPAPAYVHGDARPLLITGATGTLGQAFARLCHLRGLPYRLLSRSEMEIANTESVRAAIDQYRPWAVVNAAGYVRVDDAVHQRSDCFRANAEGPAILAQVCREYGAGLLTFSSDLVFDGAKRSPYVESDPVNPLNIYGESKAAAERQVMALHPEAMVIRTSAFFGPWDCWNFVTQTREKLHAGEPVVAAEDALISPTYVPDLVHTSLDLLIDGEQGLWHLANAGEVSWADLAREVARLAELDESLVKGRCLEELGLPQRRPRYSALGSERGSLMPSWQEALRRYFAETVPARSNADEGQSATRTECAA